MIVNDFVKPLRRHDAGEQHDVFWHEPALSAGWPGHRCGFYASRYDDRVLKAAAALLSLFSGPILALFLLGMLTKRGNFYGWCLACVVSISSTIWLQNYEFPEERLGSSLDLLFSVLVWNLFFNQSFHQLRVAE